MTLISPPTNGPTIPAIYEYSDPTDPDSEASGIVHPFCSILCRQAHDGAPGHIGDEPLEYWADGEATCETCGTVFVLATAAIDHIGIVADVLGLDLTPEHRS